MTTMNGEHETTELDGIKLKKSVNKPIAIVNGHSDGTVDNEDEVYEDPSHALQLLKTYRSRDGISIEELMDEAKTGGLTVSQHPNPHHTPKCTH